MKFCSCCLFSWYITEDSESQNNRMFRLGRELWRLGNPTPLLNQVHQSRLHRIWFWISTEKETPQTLWQPVPLFSHIQSEVFHHIQMECQFSVKQRFSNKDFPIKKIKELFLTRIYEQYISYSNISSLAENFCMCHNSLPAYSKTFLKSIVFHLH